MTPDLSELENRPWDDTDELRANSGLKASEYERRTICPVRSNGAGAAVSVL